MFGINYIFFLIIKKITNIYSECMNVNKKNLSSIFGEFSKSDTVTCTVNKELTSHMF